MPGIEDILAGVSGAPSASEGLLRLLMQQQNQQQQQQRAETFRQQDMLQREQLLQQRQANDPLRQAHTQIAQQKANQPAQPDLASILSGKPRSGLQADTGGVTGAVYGGPAPTMDQSNQRIRDIVAALSQGDRPSGLDPQTTQDFTPDYGANANPKMGSDAFRLQGFGDIGFNPQTKAFTNIGLPEQPQQAKPATAQGQPPVDLEAMNKRTILAAQLHKQGVPEKQIAERLDAEFPLTNKEIPVEKLSKLFKFNPETESFDAAPANLTDQQAREQGFRTYDQKQRESVESLKDVRVAFQQFKSALAGIQGKSALDLKTSQLSGGNLGGPEGAIFQKDATNFTTIFDKFLGGVRGAASPAMQAIRMKVLPSIISSQQVSDRLMNDMEDLIKEMSSTHIRAAIGNTPQADMASVDKKANKILKEAKTEGKYKYAPDEAKGGPETIDLGNGIVARKK